MQSKLVPMAKLIGLRLTLLPKIYLDIGLNYCEHFSRGPKYHLFASLSLDYGGGSPLASLQQLDIKNVFLHVTLRKKSIWSNL